MVSDGIPQGVRGRPLRSQDFRSGLLRQVCRFSRSSLALVVALSLAKSINVFSLEVFSCFSFTPRVRLAAGKSPWDSPELFEQRGGVTTDLVQEGEKSREVKHFSPRERRDRRFNRKASRGKLWRPETEMAEIAENENLTREEREQRFRSQIQSPVTLTTFIKRSETPQEFMWTITTAMDETMLNHIHIAAAFNRLAYLKKIAPLTEKIRRSPTLVQLAKQAARVADRREFRAREIANMLMSTAALRVDLPWITEELGSSLAKWVPDVVKDMNPHALANTVYGLGVLDLGDAAEVSSAIEACASVIPMQLGRFSSMDVAQVAWGIGARDGREDTRVLMEAIAKWVVTEASTLPTTAAVTDLPMIAVALSRLRNWQPEMIAAMTAIRERLNRNLPALRLWSLAALLWSWAEAEANEAFSEEESAATFLETLRREATMRKVTQQNIDRAPEGPKGETSNWSKSSKKTKGLTVVETF